MVYDASDYFFVILSHFVLTTYIKELKDFTYSYYSISSGSPLLIKGMREH